MAGTYPDVPGYRFAYDVDGTNASVFNLANGIYTTLSLAQRQSINSNTNSATLINSSITEHLILFFPEQRNLSGIMLNAPRTLGGTLDWSNNTSNGVDGTWTTVTNISTFQLSSVLVPDFRNNIYPLSLTNVTALRLSNVNEGATTPRGFGNIQLYGSIPTTNSPDRLRIVDLSNNAIAAQLDFGDIRQRNNVTKQFKVVNNSSTKTANNITVTLDVRTDTSPTLIGQYQLSTDNTAFANAINIGTLAPGASSGTLYVRDTVSATAQLGPWALKLIASANTWS